MFRVTRIQRANINTEIIHTIFEAVTYLEAEQFALDQDDNLVYIIRDENAKPVDRWYFFNGIRLLRWDDAYAPVSKTLNALQDLGAWFAQELTYTNDRAWEDELIQQMHKIDAVMRLLSEFANKPYLPLLKEETE